MSTSADQIRDQQRQTWDRFSAGWGRWDHIVLPMLAAVGEEMIHELHIPADAHHLDVASGTGEPGLSIAAAMPQRRVVLTDLARGMLDVARQNAARRGIHNVEIRECSADDLPFADETFDTISCRFGFMFFPEIPAAVRELKRVLKPGGRLCTAIWAEPEGNAWATLPMAAIATEIELPVQTPDAPGLFRCATAGAIGAIFQAAGFSDVAETDIRSVLTTSSAEEYWQYMTEVAAPVVAGLSKIDAAARERIKAIVIDKVAAFTDGGRPVLPIHARCVVGTR